MRIPKGIGEGELGGHSDEFEGMMNDIADDLGVLKAQINKLGEDLGTVRTAFNTLVTKLNADAANTELNDADYAQASALTFDSTDTVVTTIASDAEEEA